jgi:thioredoxin 1
MYKKILVFIILVALVFVSANAQKKSSKKQPKPQATETVQKQNTTKITFLELGSVSCIPCKKMQPVMAAIERKYGEQIKVIFSDVWKDDSKSKEYGIRLIPTQIFLDESGKELMRHEGYYPEKEIDKFLQSKRLKVIN